MVHTITPVVDGERASRYWLSVALYTLGATASAAVLGAVLGAAGALIRAPWGSLGADLLVLAAAIYAARELLHAPVPIPDRHRQVPEWWRTFFSPPAAAVLYGLSLGIGFLTFLTFGTFVVVALGALLSGSPLTGALLCAGFGLGRAVAVLLGMSPRLQAALENGAVRVGARVANGGVLAAIAVTGLAASRL
jgi:sulfite exporter TauE/SafE